MLSISAISYRIGDCEIVRDVTAFLSKAGVVALVGPNGAGKTTLINILSGCIRPSSGLVYYNGNKISRLEPDQIARLGIARTFQEQHLAWNMTALQNLLCAFDVHEDWRWARTIFYRKYCHLKDIEARERAYSVLQRFRLENYADIPVRELSYGQQRLIMVARAFAIPAKLMILDEPFSGIKEAFLDIILRELREAIGNGASLIVIDHKLSILREIAKTYWFMNRGRLSVYPSYSSMTASEEFNRDYLGLKGTTHVAPQSIIDAGEHKESGGCNVYATKENNSMLRLINVSGGYGKKRVVENVNLAVNRGEIVGLIGANGSGKSTLLRTIAGAARLFEGDILLDDVSIKEQPTEKRILIGLRLLPQEHRLFPSLSVQDNIALATLSFEDSRITVGAIPRKFRSLSSSKGRLNTTLLADKGENFLKRKAGTISGGEQASVSLGLLEFGLPRLILLDEPTAGIDGIARDKLVKSIENWQKRDAGIIIAEHNIDFLLSITSNIYLVKDGRICRCPSNETDLIYGEMTN
jgi:ABC-type branched-subunit amino acid transport system ATPase component